MSVTIPRNGVMAQTDRMTDELRRWQAEMEPLRRKWNDYWMRWRIEPGQTDPNNTYRSQIRVPLSHFHVEVVVPRVVGSGVELRYRAVDSMRDAPVAQLHTGVARFQSELMDLKLHVKRFVRQGAITGYSVAKTGWIKEFTTKTYTEHVSHYDEQLGTTFNFERERTDEHALRRSQPWVQTVNVLDFVFPLWAPNLNAAPAVWQRSWVTMAHLQEMQRQGIYSHIDQVEPDGVAEIQRSRQPQWGQMGLSFAPTDTDDRNAPPELQMVELWERWTDDELCVIVSPGNKAVMIREDPNPYNHGMKPFIDWSPVPEVFNMHGIGLVAGLHDLEEELTTFRRQRTDGLNYAVNPAMKGRGIMGNQLAMYPGRYIPVDDLSDLEPIQMPTVDWGALERVEEQIKLDAQNVSGASAPLSGDTSSGGQAATTATGISTVTNESNKRLDEMRDELAQRALKRLGFQLASMNAQFLDKEFAVNFSDDPQALQAWLQVSEYDDLPDEVSQTRMAQIQPDWMRTHGRLMVVPEVGVDEERQRQQDQLEATQLTQAVGPFLAMVPPPISVKQLVDYTLEKFGVPADRRHAMMDNSEEQAQAAQAQLAAQQQPPGDDGGPGGDNQATGAVGGVPGVA